MASVLLSDIVDITVYRDLEPEIHPEITAFWESGVVVGGDYFNQLAAADGRTAEMIFWRDLDPAVEPNYSDDSDDRATPGKTRQDDATAKKAHLNKGYSSKDLSRELQTGVDAMQFIRNRFSAYWTRNWQRRIINCTIGLFNANVAGNFDANAAVAGVAGDMVLDISIEDGDNALAANLFSRTAFTQAAFTMGDHVDMIRAILVHSVVYQRMVDSDDIDFIRDSQGTMLIPTYLGKRVIIDDSCPKIAGSTSGFRYISVMYGEAMFGYGEADPTVPVEVWRDPQTGQGGGEEQIWERKTWLIHPLGWTNENAVATANAGSQSLADLQDESNWTRTHSRKNVPIAFLVTNG